MPRLRSREVGKLSVSAEPATPVQAGHKIELPFSEAPMSSRKANGASLTSGSVVRRSARLNSGLNAVTLTPQDSSDRNLTPFEGNVDPGAVAFDRGNVDPSVDKENIGSTGRGCGNGGRKRGKGKGALSNGGHFKLEDNSNAEAPRNVDAGNVRETRSRGKRKLNDGMPLEVKIFEDESVKEAEMLVKAQANNVNEEIYPCTEKAEMEAPIVQISFSETNGTSANLKTNATADDCQQNGRETGSCGRQNENRGTERVRNSEPASSYQRSRPNVANKSDERKRDGFGPYSISGCNDQEASLTMGEGNTESGTVAFSQKEQDPSVNKENLGSTSQSSGNVTVRGQKRGKEKCKLSTVPCELLDSSNGKETQNVDKDNVRGKWSRGREGKEKQKSNDDMLPEVKFSEDESVKKAEIGANSDGNHGNGETHPSVEAVELEASAVQIDFSGATVVPSTLQSKAVDVFHQNGAEENGGLGRQYQNWNRRTARERFLEIARNRASHFAHFDPENGEPSSSQQRTQHAVTEENDEEKRDWPGPFSTARRLVDERAMALAARQEKLSASGTSASLIEWTPSREKDMAFKLDGPPPLFELCLRLLCKHVEDIESLEGVPDAAKNRISSALCASRKMTPQVLGLFMKGSPTEICVPDCSLISEEDLTKLTAQFSTSNLEVLKLGLCGRGLSDRWVKATFTSSVGLPCLTTLTLNGAYRLSDAGLCRLVRSAPLLSSIDLSRCSYLSEGAIHTIAGSLASSLKELHLDECQQLEAHKILPALKKMQNLEILSVAGVPSVTDAFAIELLAERGCNLKQLSLADCGKLTNSPIEVIGNACHGLNVLILDNLCLLTDTALVHLTNGCRSLQTLSLRRCSFSDEAVATFIGASGNCLTDLSLNSVKKVADHTVYALASTAYDTLSRLDASWCRNLTDEALGLVADSCSFLHELILFGCTQVSDKFLKGHSNSNLKIIGLEEPLLY